MSTPTLKKDRRTNRFAALGVVAAKVVVKASSASYRHGTLTLMFDDYERQSPLGGVVYQAHRLDALTNTQTSTPADAPAKRFDVGMDPYSPFYGPRVFVADQALTLSSALKRMAKVHSALAIADAHASKMAAVQGPYTCELWRLVRAFANLGCPVEIEVRDVSETDPTGVGIAFANNESLPAEETDEHCLAGDSYTLRRAALYAALRRTEMNWNDRNARELRQRIRVLEGLEKRASRPAQSPDDAAADQADALHDAALARIEAADQDEQDAVDEASR